MIPLLGHTLKELEGVAAELGMPRFGAKQMAQWLYRKNVRSVDEMTNLSKAVRERMKERYEVGVKEPLERDDLPDRPSVHRAPPGEIGITVGADGGRNADREAFAAVECRGVVRIDGPQHGRADRRSRPSWQVLRHCAPPCPS